ncbi:MAG: glycosyltransferase [Lachnospiraceae bacterium]|nr:glycosyltransferase [Lachnospiraceae bacterium]
MKPLISVIIPVYKVEKYLRRAVDSVLSQTYTNLEIILVDDGSPDECPAICDAYAAKEARVRVIHKENGGLSDARNAGIDVAGGDYIAFLDSDDYYAPCFIEVLYRELVKSDAQVSLCRYEVTEKLDVADGPDFAGVWQEYKDGKTESFVYDRKQMLLNQYDAHCPDATYFIVAWNKLYKASLFKQVRYPKGKIHEDEATTYRIFDKITRGVYVNAPLYAYYSMPDSITRAKFHVKRLQWFDALDDRIDFLEKKSETESWKAAVRARADGAIRYYYPLIKTCPREKAEAKRLRGYVKQALSYNRSGKDPQKGFLRFVTVIGYHLFLVSPDIYHMITKVGKDSCQK